jgi:outer membrane protein assembly factor BamB
MRKRTLGLTVFDPHKAYPGYTLFATTPGTRMYLVDMRGRVVHAWDLPSPPADSGCLLEDGRLVVACRSADNPIPFGGRGGLILELDWDGKVIWEYKDNGLHHDFWRMPNGHTMVLGWEPVPKELAPRIKGGVAGSEHERGIYCDYLHEVTPDKKVVWEWHAYEHLDPETDVVCPLHKRVEWTHANTCKVLPDGNVITCFRLLNTVAIVDKKTGAFAWRWGPGELGHPHDPSVLANGNVLVFDNGSHRIEPPGHVYSRVVEVDPKSRRIVWKYEARPGWDFFSSFVSGVERLPNGNTLICEGMTGRLFEVTREGEIVWEYVNPFFATDAVFGWVNRVFRCLRYAPDFPGLRGKTLDPSRYEALNRAAEVV